MSFKLWEDEGHPKVCPTLDAIEAFQNLDMRIIVNALSAPTIIELFHLLFDNKSDLNLDSLNFSFVLAHQLN